ncbi:hypothetical protein GGI42DRAFT_328827 [Trichoderma sp. SZMC 28013]
MKAVFITSILFTNLAAALSMSSRQLPPLVPALGQVVQSAVCDYLEEEVPYLCSLIQAQVNVGGCKATKLDGLKQACDQLKEE